MNPIDRLVGLEAVKKAVDKEHKAAKLDAEDYFAEMEQKGIKSLGSTVFGDSGGEFKRGTTRAKETVEYVNDDWEKFDKWLEANKAQVFRYVFDNHEPFCAYWVDEFGEVPDGIVRKHHKIPAGQTSPKLYKFDEEGVLEVFAELGGLFKGANILLLEDGE